MIDWRDAWRIGPSSLAQLAGACATTAAVLVALFKDEVVRLLRRPRLVVRINSEPPDCLLSPVMRSGVIAGDAYWLRLWIENTGSARAEEVQVFLSKVFKRNARREFESIADFAPMNLRWSNARDWKAPEIFAAGISHKMGKHCDLCAILDPSIPHASLAGHQGQCIADLQLEVFPTGDRHRLPPGNYILELLIAASNTDPVPVFIELSFDGSWSGELATMFREHLGVKISKAPKISKR